MNILRSAALVSFFTIISRISGYARDILIARIAGTGFFADVFFAAFKMTNLLRKVLIDGSFFAAFVPSFSKIKEKYGKDEALIFSSKMLSIALYIVLAITILANIFMPQVTKFMAPGFTGEKLALTISLSYIIFWYFIFICLISIISGVLNGLHKFSYYAIVPIFMNLSMIFFTLFLQDYFENIGYCLAWAVVFGGLVQFLFIYLACVYEKFIVKIQLPSKKLFDENTKSAYKKMLPSIIGGSLSQINTMVDLVLGSMIASGVSYLYYTDRIFFLPTSVIGTAISIVILPLISKQIAQGKIDSANHLVGEAISLSTIMVLPAAFVLLLNSSMLTSVTFEGGAFTASDVNVVSTMLQILAVALPFCVFNKIASTIFFSHSDTKTPMYITLVSVFINVGISIFLMKLGFGVFGITVGTAISYFLSCVISVIILMKRRLLFIGVDIAKFVVKVALSSGISAVLMQWCVMHKTFGYYAIIHDASFITKLTYILGTVGIAGFTFLLLSRFLGVNILHILFARKRNQPL